MGTYCDPTFNQIIRKPLLNIFDETLKCSSLNSKDIFSRFMKEMDCHHNRMAHCLQDLKQRDDKTIKGHIFEVFAKLYLEIVLKIPHVWLLKDVPDEHLNKVQLKRRDVGIDIIGLDKDGNYYACQVKYKTQSTSNKRKIAVTWKEISTFFALSERTGPYANFIVVTTANYVRHVAPKTAKDLSICIGTLSHISRNCWREMRNLLACELGSTTSVSEHSFSSVISKDLIDNAQTNNQTSKSRKQRVYFDVYNETTQKWNLCENDHQKIETFKKSVTPELQNDKKTTPVVCHRDTDENQKMRNARLCHFSS